MLDIQRASLLKRLSAALLDFILLLILSVGAGWLTSVICNYDSHIKKIEEYYEYYNEKYDIDLLGTSDKYKDLNEEEQKAYDERYQQANEEYANDKEAIKEFSLVINLSILVVSIGVFFGIFISEFIIPLFLKNGQTIGKKVFSVGVIKNNCVKMSTFQLFVRTIIGKYTIEAMIPILLIIAIIFGIVDIVGTIVILGMLITQIILLFATRNHTLIHDAFAYTVVVDLPSQMTFDNEDELIKYKTKLHEEEVNRIKTY